MEIRDSTTFQTKVANTIYLISDFVLKLKYLKILLKGLKCFVCFFKTGWELYFLKCFTF